MSVTVSQPAPQPSLNHINEILNNYIERYEAENQDAPDRDKVWNYLDGVEKAREIIQETQPKIEQIGDILNDYIDKCDQEGRDDDNKDALYAYLDGVERAWEIVQSVI